jgi:hypothetical protein
VFDTILDAVVVERLIEVERATGIQREASRPDLFKRD